MNILQIGTTDTRGGAAKVSYSLKHKLEQQGHRTSMFVGKKYSRDFNIYEIRPSIYKKIICRLLGTEIDFWNTDYILETDAFKNADVIHCHNLHGYYFNLNTLKKMSKKKPIIWTLHDMWAITPSCHHTTVEEPIDGFFPCLGYKSPAKLSWHNDSYLQWKKNKIYSEIDLEIVTPSNWLKRKVEKSILANHEINLIYNGIDTLIFKKYEKTIVRKELNLPQDKKIILFLANMGTDNPWKGHMYLEQLMEYYKKYKNMLFISIGGNSNKFHYNFKNISYIDNEHMLSKYYSASDILLFTSIAENFPLVPLESMACGTPIVCFNIGGISEMVEHKKTGYITEKNNLNDLMTGVEYILNLNKENYLTMSDNAIKKIWKLFTLDTMTNNYLKLYQNNL